MRRIKRSADGRYWSVNAKGRDLADLPPDLTPLGRGWFRGPDCRAELDGYACTRNAGHTGRHAAGTGVNIVAVWP